jgi:hypothetical protein
VTASAAEVAPGYSIHLRSPDRAPGGVLARLARIAPRRVHDYDNHMEDKTPPNKGGRPPKPEDERLSVPIMLRLTTAMHAKLQRLGGVEWLRDRIERAKDPGRAK